MRAGVRQRCRSQGRRGRPAPRRAPPACRVHGPAPPVRTSRLEIPVTDVVDAPRERVGGAHRLALETRQQANAVVEIRGPAAGDLLAFAVRVLDLDRSGSSSACHCPHAACRAVAEAARARRAASASSACSPPAAKPATAIRGASGSVRASGAPLRAMLARGRTRTRSAPAAAQTAARRQILATAPEARQVLPRACKRAHDGGPRRCPAGARRPAGPRRHDRTAPHARAWRRRRRRARVRPPGRPTACSSRAAASNVS